MVIQHLVFCATPWLQGSRCISTAEIVVRRTKEDGLAVLNASVVLFQRRIVSKCSIIIFCFILCNMAVGNLNGQNKFGASSIDHWEDIKKSREKVNRNDQEVISAEVVKKTKEQFPFKIGNAFLGMDKASFLDLYPYAVSSTGPYENTENYTFFAESNVAAATFFSNEIAALVLSVGSGNLPLEENNQFGIGVIKYLLELYGNPNSKEEVEGGTVLKWSLFHGELEIMLEVKPDDSKRVNYVVSGMDMNKILAHLNSMSSE